MTNKAHLSLCHSPPHPPHPPPPPSLSAFIWIALVLQSLSWFSLCKLVPPTQNLWHIPARIISTQLSSPSLKIIYSEKAFLSLKSKENPITLSYTTLFLFIAGSTVTNYMFISVCICWMSVSTLEAHCFKGKDPASLFPVCLRQYPAHNKHSGNICRVDD